MAAGKPRVQKPCGRCGDPHHHFARCKDGEFAINKAPVFKKGDPLRGAAKRNAEAKKAAEAGIVPVSETQDTVPVEVTTTTTDTNVTVTATDTNTSINITATSARDDLRALAASLPEDSQQRRSIELMIARDEAREGHARAEQELQSSDPTARLPVPIILRDTSEEAGRHLNMEMDRLIFQAGNSRASQREILPKEAQSVHDTLTGLEERREAAQREPERPVHRPGSQPWFCHDKGHRFNSGTIDEVREWARKDPTYRLACPECGSGKVQVIDAA